MQLILIIFLLSLNSYFASDRQIQQFNELYNFASQYKAPIIGTSPGNYLTAPLDLKVEPEMPANAYSYLLGSFSQEPAMGDKVILYEWPDRGNALVSIYKTQYFSGYRWFWYGEPNGDFGKISGGYYDLSETTIPKNPKLNKSYHMLNLNWDPPKASGYGTRISLFRSPYKENLINPKSGEIVYDGYGNQTSFKMPFYPGNYYQVGFFGMREINGLKIDSGAGVQTFTASSGAYNPVAGVFTSKKGDGFELRSLIEFSVPKLYSEPDRYIKYRPPLASEPVDDNGTTMPWMESDRRYILRGSHFKAKTRNEWRLGLSKIIEHDPNTGAIGIVSPLSILDGDENRVVVNLFDRPENSGIGEILGETESCRKLIFYVVQEGDTINAETSLETNFASNAITLKIIHANPFLARQCQL